MDNYKYDMTVDKINKAIAYHEKRIDILKVDTRYSQDYVGIYLPRHELRLSLLKEKLANKQSISRISKHSLEIIEYRKNNPCLTLQQVGNKYGISRERVRQILKRAKEKTTHYYNNKKVAVVCSQCNKIFYLKEYDLIDRENLTNKTGGRFCSNKCAGYFKFEHNMVNIPVERIYNYDTIQSQYNKGMSLNEIAISNNTTTGIIGAIIHNLRKQGKIPHYRYKSIELKQQV
jgi:uncharacterized CHY-type Zn-finger protein